MTNQYLIAQMNYLAPSVESSLYRNGKVFAHRDIEGNDGPFHGAEMEHRNVVIKNGRHADAPINLR